MHLINFIKQNLFRIQSTVYTNETLNQQKDYKNNVKHKLNLISLSKVNELFSNIFRILNDLYNVFNILEQWHLELKRYNESISKNLVGSLHIVVFALSY